MLSEKLQTLKNESRLVSATTFGTPRTYTKNQDANQRMANVGENSIRDNAIREERQTKYRFGLFSSTSGSNSAMSLCFNVPYSERVQPRMLCSLAKSTDSRSAGNIVHQN